MITVLLIAQDQQALDRLRKLVATDAELLIVATASGGHDAVRAIQQFSPDVLLMEVELSLAEGFDLVRAAKTDHTPLLIRATPYGAFAVRMFDLQATDLVLSALDSRRLEAHLDRMRTREGPDEARGQRDSFHTLPLASSPPRATSELMVRVNSGDRSLDVDEIDWIESDGNYVRVHLTTAVYRIRRTLVSMEAELSSTRFVRIGRRIIVNIERVREVRAAGSRVATAVLHDGRSLRVSSAYCDRLLSEFKSC
jgi:two-component system, LytTR family, response regulator